MTEFRPALFLDRDGVLNVDRGYVSRVEDFVWIDGAIDCVKAFNARGWWVFVVTNQTAIAFDHYSEDDMHAVHERMLAELAEAGARIDQIYHTPHHPEGTNQRYRKDSFDRKPKPGMILQAMADFRVKREYSFLIGDKPTDIRAAHAANIGGFLFNGGNLADFAEWALASFEDGSR
ncbi:MAG: HAD family hydrolase [Alphaproteobacteria bacterium]|nr:HAD family hydrolase [Alphaproteobacteria bacterium]